MLVIWMVLALASFIGAWFAPVGVAVINWIFGSVNILVSAAIIAAWKAGFREVDNGQKNAE